MTKKWGKDRPTKTVWIPDIRRYQVERLADGVRPGTVNREQATVSKLFSVLVELQLIEANPVRMMPVLSRKSGQRQVYLSYGDAEWIIACVSPWLCPIVWAAFYTGMRRGEILGLTRNQVDLARRIVTRSPGDTKEGDWKRVPIHKKLFPILKRALSGKVQSTSIDRVFLLAGHPPNKDPLKNT